MLAQARTAALTASLAAFLVPLVEAHGYVKQLQIGSQTVDAWLPFTDPYLDPVPNKLTRKFDSDGPVTDVTSKAITCNTNGQAGVDVPVSTVQKGVKGGDKVTFQWTPWPSDHKGPVMTYLANCGGDCTKFDGSTGNAWFKIDEAGLADGKWASDKLIADGSKWTVTIPSSIASGQYLLRHEILALHSASTLNGGQFYPSCHQIEITSSGSQKPAGVALPGAYKATDPGIKVDIWADGFKSYTIPGPAVFSATSSGDDSSSETPSGGASSTDAASSAATDPASQSATTTSITLTSTVHAVGTKTPSVGSCSSGNQANVAGSRHRSHKAKPKKSSHKKHKKHGRHGKKHHRQQRHRHHHRHHHKASN